jgi:hypothetical protein
MLNKAQTEMLHKLVAEGMTLSQIQSKLQEAGAEITYMQLRMLIDDMNLQLQERAAAPVQPEVDKATTSQSDIPEADAEMPAAGGVSVELDRVVRPGAMVSGSVTFGDGVRVSWSLDQMGRLGLLGAPQGYQPSREDILEFQTQLRGLLETRGA